MHLLVLDFPRADRCVSGAWQTTVDAWVAAHQRTGAPCGVVASMPEGLPDGVARQLLERGIAPMQGLAECLDAIGHAATVGAARRRISDLRPVQALAAPRGGAARIHDEFAGKQALASFGVPVPRGGVVVAGEAVARAEALGYPVVVKAVSAELAHKTEAGAVFLNLRTAAQVTEAVRAMAGLSGQFLVEQMAQGVVAEFIVGVRRDPQFGLALTLGAGGVLVELLQDAATLLLPATRADIRAAFASLRSWPLACGLPGPACRRCRGLAGRRRGHRRVSRRPMPTTLLELDVNPVLVLPQGQGVVAVDVLIRLDGRGVRHDRCGAHRGAGRRVDDHAGPAQGQCDRCRHQRPAVCGVRRGCRTIRRCAWPSSPAPGGSSRPAGT